MQGLYAEMVQRSHRLLGEQAGAHADLITATLSFPLHRIVYSTYDRKIRALLWQATAALIKETGEAISPLSLPIFLKGYFDFSFHSARGYRFFESNNHPFVARTPFSETSPDLLS